MRALEASPMTSRSCSLRLIILVLAIASPFADVQAHDEHDHAAGGRNAATPFGRPGDPAHASRTVSVTMNDQMRYTPSQINVRKGETLRLAVHNEGKLRHELVLGTRAALKRHAEMMKRFPDMVHDDPNAVHVEPGATADLVWTFDRAGVFAFACLVPGHYEAGMSGKVIVK
jgi:uncharacterized cupredoxin-like copper-binding protein